jgi:hypothetical protein
MAKRIITLEMTPAEEAALSALLRWVCARIVDPEKGAPPPPTLPLGSYQQLGKLNGALNANR